MKTTNKLEATRRVTGLIAIAIIAIAMATATIACKNDEPTDTPNPVTREFTITGFAKPVTVKDMRTGKDDTDLETLGVISRLTAGLQAQSGDEFNRAIGFGLIIEVEKTTEYQRFIARSGNRMGANIDYVLSDDEYFSTRMDSFFAIMAEKKPDGAPEDTPRTLSFGTTEAPCTVTITSDDQFTATEWKTLCDKVVAAIERGYGAAGGMAKGGIATYFTNNTVSAVLLKSATYDVEVKNTVPNTMYFKANGSAIDGISGDNFLLIINVIVSGNSYHVPE